MLYSYKNQYPQPLPHRIVLSTGQTRTDPATFTSEEILDAGYVAVDDFRVTKGVARYIANFTPPGSAHSAI